MNLKSKILAVHGYEIGPGGYLYPLSAAICNEVCRLHHQRDKIALLGGWHLHDVGPRPTIGEAMKSRLINLGVPAAKLYTQFDLGLDTIRPCRDTAEETWMFASFLTAMGYNPRQVEFDALVISYFKARARCLYDYTGGQCRRILGANGPGVWQPSRMATEVVALGATLADPTCQLNIFKRTRASRTLDTSPYEHLPELSDWSK